MRLPYEIAHHPPIKIPRELNPLQRIRFISLDAEPADLLIRAKIDPFKFL